MNGGLVVVGYLMTVGFIDIKLVGANRGIDDRTSFPVPCYNYRVSICGNGCHLSRKDAAQSNEG